MKKLTVQANASLISGDESLAPVLDPSNESRERVPGRPQKGAPTEEKNNLRPSAGSGTAAIAGGVVEDRVRAPKK